MTNDPEPKVINVNDSEEPYEIAKTPEILESGGFDVCIVITLMHEHRAFMVHSPLLHYEGSNGTHAFFEMLQQEIPDDERPNRLVVLAGSLIEQDEDPRLVQASAEARTFALEHLNRLNFKKINIRWTPSGCGLHVKVETSRRTATVETSMLRRGKFAVLSLEEIFLS